MATGRRKPKAHEPHWHQCTTGFHAYEDTCDTRQINSQCASCRVRNPRPRWLLDRDPIECCLRAARPASREEVDKYRLAGSAGWLLCTTCHRTIGTRTRT